MHRMIMIWLILLLLLMIMMIMFTESNVLDNIIEQQRFSRSSKNDYNPNHQCKYHQDCNQLLTKILSCSNASIEMYRMIDNDCTEEYHRQLLLYLKQNPRVSCHENRCLCHDPAYSYDSIDRICRYRCKHDGDCRSILNEPQQQSIIVDYSSYGLGHQSKKLHDYMESYNRFIPMICSEQGLCRCPQYSRQSLLDWTKHSCLEEIQIEFHNVNFIAITAVSLLFLIIIIMAPIFIFCFGQHTNAYSGLRQTI
ncbi:uncharacterized protein LOC124490945 [Dermatophagoides farinae]|nr:uncharacterized protein LOC124490945 [Dermatophagoides farinae]